MKSQSSLEFVFIAAFLLTIFVVATSILNNNLQENREQLLADSVERVAKSIEGEIKLAKAMSDGYSRKILVPKKINNKDYEISLLANTELVVKADAYEYVTFLPQGVRGSVGRGTNLIEKREGIVYIQGIDILISDRFYFRKDMDGVNKAVFKSTGDIAIAGTLTQQTSYNPTTDDEFFIKNSGREVVLAINLDTGNMYIKGTLLEYELPDMALSGNEVLTFSNEKGETVIKIDEDGNLFISGGLIQKGNPR